MPPYSRTRRFYSLLQFMYYGAFCASVTYMVPVLQLYGWTDARIGLLMTLSAAGGAVAQPVWGALCDRFRCTRAVVFVLTAAPAIFYALMEFFGATPWAMTVLMVLCGMTNQSAAGIVDSWASKLSGDGYEVSYGLSRGLGSLSYALTSAVVGLFLARFGVTALWPAVLLFTPGLLIAVSRLPEPRVPEKKDRRSLKSDISELLRNKPFRTMAACNFLGMITFGAMITFFPVALTSLGGTPAHFGAAYGGMAAAELLTMSQYRRLRRRFSCETLLGVSMVFFGVKNVLVGLSPSVPFAMAALLTQALGYALNVPAVVDYISQKVDRRLTATAQLTAYAVCISLAQIFANAACGYISSVTGPQTMLLIASVPAFAGGAAWLAASRKLKLLPD